MSLSLWNPGWVFYLSEFSIVIITPPFFLTMKMMMMIVFTRCFVFQGLKGPPGTPGFQVSYFIRNLGQYFYCAYGISLPWYLMLQMFLPQGPRGPPGLPGTPGTPGLDVSTNKYMVVISSWTKAIQQQQPLPCFYVHLGYSRSRWKARNPRPSRWPSMYIN